MKRAQLTLRDYIGVGLVFAFISVLVALLFKNIPQANEQLIVYMLGQLSGFVGTVVAFHYVLNKNSETATENTGKAFDALKAAAESTPPADSKALREGDTVTPHKQP